MNDIGEFALLLALATALYGIVSYVMAFRSNRVDVYLSADKTPIIVWGCVMVASKIAASEGLDAGWRLVANILDMAMSSADNRANNARLSRTVGN